MLLGTIAGSLLLAVCVAWDWFSLMCTLQKHTLLVKIILLFGLSRLQQTEGYRGQEHRVGGTAREYEERAGEPLTIRQR